MKRLSIVIVTYKTRDFVLQAVESAYQSFSGPAEDLDIVVVDNCSRDGTVEALRERFPLVRIIENSENRGPAYAFNQGLRAVWNSTPYILVANSDIKLLKGTLDCMLAYLDSHPDVHGCPAHLLNEDMTEQRHRYHLTRLLPLDYSKPFRVTQIGTTCAMIRREAFRVIGGYDENYYFYNEDFDWSQRAVRAGMKFMCIPEAKAIHFVSRGRKQNNARIIRELYWSNLYYYRKFYPLIAGLAYRVMKLEIRLKARQIRKELDSLNCPSDRRQELQDLLRAYRESLELLEQEYRHPHEPKIPMFI